MRACAIIPSYNHYRAVLGIIERLRALGLAILIVDDGSAEPARQALAELHEPERGVRVTRLPVNGGKGHAVLTGFRQALAEGFTHLVQVDADGQHDLAALPPMLALAAQHPDSVVAGYAVYDTTAPLGRVVSRWITHVCVWAETLSFAIRDSMCGLRVYPSAAVARLLDRRARVGQRMDFDTEILVRLRRVGTPIVNHPVSVTYPPGNTSNFDMWRDNLRISAMHMRLLLGLPFDWPRERETTASGHWARLGERGLYWGLALSGLVLRLLGRRGCFILLVPVVLYFYATAGDRRRASLEFLRRAFTAAGHARTPTWRDGFRHYLTFARRALDTIAAWVGKLPTNAVVEGDVAALRAATADTRGAVFIVSHYGNVDVSRAQLDAGTRRRVVVLLHTRHAENYNRVMRELNPGAALDTFEVTEIGPDTAIALQQRVDKGDWLFIAGDRTPIGNGRRSSRVDFLSAPADFSQGPYLLAALLDCPVYLFFCSERDGRYRLDVERFAERIVLPRGRRDVALAGYVQEYAARLEKHVLSDPYQWYNFYDFWRSATWSVDDHR
jgi:predicted LPLAT superfamily acyltransferase